MEALCAPTVSVVIATSAGRESLRAMLYSLEGQSFPTGSQILVVDNTGALCTERMVREYRTAPVPVSYLLANAIPGRSYATNAGAREATGEVLLFLDDDDTAEPGYVERMAAAVAVHQFVGGKLDPLLINPAWSAHRRPLIQYDRLPLHSGVPFVGGGALGIETTLFLSVGGFDEQMAIHEDVDLSLRLLHDRGIGPTFVPDAVVNYRYRDTLRGIYAQERAYGRASVALARKHRGVIPRRTARTLARRTVDVAKAAAGVTGDESGRARLATALGSLVGHAHGLTSR